MKIRCLTNKQLNSKFGTNVDIKVYNYIYNKLGKGIADEFLEKECERTNSYSLKDAGNPEIRFNSILLDAFESTDVDNYKIVECDFNFEQFQNIEVGAILRFQ